jgi:dipeptidyl-peptidase III
MSAESSSSQISQFVDPAEAEIFQKHKLSAYYLWVVLHELLGHGTGKMMCQLSEKEFNFNVKSPPLDPLSGNPISSWYLPGQTWTGQFADLATTVGECRAELVGAYLMNDADLLALFGSNESSTITASDSEWRRVSDFFADQIFSHLQHLHAAWC